jgi:DNA-binding transcriptional MerR regulator/methylmalonyl-CoA mutase cobalamin-binding subunit
VETRYPIRAVSKITGIPVETLRAWERRHRVVEPARDARGRLYTAAEVERLHLLRRAVGAGHSIGRAAALSTEELRALAVERTDSFAVPSSLRELHDAVERLDAPALRAELSRLAALLPLRALCRDVALPLLRHAGEAWRAGRLGIAQEHLASAEVRNLLGALARLHAGGWREPTVVFGTPPGELHEIGTLAASLVAADAGFGAVYLGPNVPAADFLTAASRAAATVIVLGWTRAGDGATAGRTALAALAREAAAPIELWVGGRGADDARRATRGRAIALESFDAFERELARLRGG